MLPSIRLDARKELPLDPFNARDDFLATSVLKIGNGLEGSFDILPAILENGVSTSGMLLASTDSTELESECLKNHFIKVYRVGKHSSPL